MQVVSGNEQEEQVMREAILEFSRSEAKLFHPHEDLIVPLSTFKELLYLWYLAIKEQFLYTWNTGGDNGARQARPRHTYTRRVCRDYNVTYPLTWRCILCGDEFKITWINCLCELACHSVFCNDVQLFNHPVIRKKWEKKKFPTHFGVFQTQTCRKCCYIYFFEIYIIITN